MSSGAIRAAGGVVWQRVNGTNGDPAVEIALIHRPRYDDWSFPKGKLSAGETEVEGAVREVLEETGYRVRVGRPLGETRAIGSVPAMASETKSSGTGLCRRTAGSS